MYVWKILNGFYPNDINIEFKEHVRFKAIKAIVKPLPKTKGKVLTLFENSFVVKSARLWNVIPPQVSRIDNLPKFKLELDNFLSTISDQPPLPSYPYKNNNSLVQHCGICI